MRTKTRQLFYLNTNGIQGLTVHSSLNSWLLPTCLKFRSGPAYPDPFFYPNSIGFQGPTALGLPSSWLLPTCLKIGSGPPHPEMFSF